MLPLGLTEYDCEPLEGALVKTLMDAEKSPALASQSSSQSRTVNSRKNNKSTQNIMSLFHPVNCCGKIYSPISIFCSTVLM
jgi:hypothetical protein